MRAVQLGRGGFEQGFNRQGGFSTARHACNADKLAQGKFSRDVFQVVSGGPDHRELLPVAFAPNLGHRDFATARQVLSRQAGRVLGHLFRRAMRHDHSAMHASPRPHIKDIIRFTDRVLVVFHHQNRIDLIAQVFQRGQQAVIVALVQPDRRFIQHIKHPRQPAADLACQPDALAFPTRQRAGIAAERQVIQAHIHQEPQPLADFLQDGAGDFVFLVGQASGHRADPVKRLLDRHLNHLPHMQVGNLHRQRLGTQAIARTGPARPVVLEPLHLLAAPSAVGLAVAPLHVGDHPFKDAGHLIDAAPLVIAERDLLTARSMQEEILHLLRQVLPFGFLVKAIVLGHGVDGLGEIGAF